VSKPDCCEFMRQQLDYLCENHGRRCPSQVLRWVKHSLGSDDDFRKVWNVSLIAGNAEYECKFCPECGTPIDQDSPEGD
jgi:hypothetical protein